MEVAVRWQALIALIQTYCPKAGKKGGRPPHPLATMRRIHLPRIVILSIPQPWKRP